MSDTADDLPRLNAAIARVSKEVLAAVLMKICQDNPSTREFVKGHLFVNESQVPRPGTPPDPDLDSDLEDGEDSEDSDDSNESEVGEKKQNAVPRPTTTGPKRLRTRYAVCINCKEEFDVSENTRKSCSYHPEYPEPDYDMWPDHDENCHGPINTEENLRKDPESFIYPCCDRHGDEKPCTTDWHREHWYDYSKRQKY